jgi:hypothetical protein
LQLCSRPVGIKQPRFQGIGIVQLTAHVHGELYFPTHRFDNAGGGNFIVIGVLEQNLEMGAFLERRHFDVDTQTITIGVWFGGQ